MKAIDDGNVGMIFLHTRHFETFLISFILATVFWEVASSGIAATLLGGCRTAYSTLKLPFKFVIFNMFFNHFKVDEPTC